MLLCCTNTITFHSIMVMKNIHYDYVIMLLYVRNMLSVCIDINIYAETCMNM